MGVRRPSAGSVRVDGAEVASWNRDEFCAHAGYLPQDIELFSGTVAQNICRFGEASSEAILAEARTRGVEVLDLF